jgi:hypothetical protein
MYFPYKNEYGIFRLVEITIIRGLRQKGKSGGDETIQNIIHICMKMS